MNEASRVFISVKFYFVKELLFILNMLSTVPLDGVVFFLRAAVVLNLEARGQKHPKANTRQSIERHLLHAVPGANDAKWENKSSAKEFNGIQPCSSC